jgi:acetolactate synthase regulatory subunit
MAKKAEGARLDEIRQSIAKLTSESDKVSLLLQIANDLRKDNQKAQLQVLEEARQVVNHRAFQLRSLRKSGTSCTGVFSAVDSSRSFEILEPGISQLNELLSAAQTLSGFEVNIFRDRRNGNFQCGWREWVEFDDIPVQ